MRENPYKRLPPIERKQDSSLYRMTPEIGRAHV